MRVLKKVLLKVEKKETKKGNTSRGCHCTAQMSVPSASSCRRDSADIARAGDTKKRERALEADTKPPHRVPSLLSVADLHEPSCVAQAKRRRALRDHRAPQRAMAAGGDCARSEAASRTALQQLSRACSSLRKCTTSSDGSSVDDKYSRWPYVNDL